MNYSIISYIIGWILNFEALFMLLPCIVAVIYKESSGWAFVLAMLLCLLIGIPLTQRKPKNKIFYTKEGFVTVALSWIVLSIIGVSQGMLFPDIVQFPLSEVAILQEIMEDLSFLRCV